MSASPSVVDLHPVAPTVTLDRSGEPWVGTFPGLGTVRVWADGRVEAEATGGDAGGGDGPGDSGRPGDSAGADSGADEAAELRHAALVHGWGEPLALARQGFHIAYATAVVAPDTDRCLLIGGDPHDTAIVALGLAARGWRVLADRLTPLVVDAPAAPGGPAAGSGITAHPRPGPVLASARRAARTDLQGTPVRADTDVVAVTVARTSESHPVAAVVTARIRRPHDPLLDELRGHRRVETANPLIASGVLAPGATESEHAAGAMARTLRLAALPMTAVHVDPTEPAAAIDAVIDWWAAR